MTLMQRREPSVVGRYGRLKLIGAGVVLALVGIARIMTNVQVQLNGHGQPTFSWGLVSAGGICILLVLVPISWITRATRTKHSNDHR
jgi:hypothetical protein